MDHILAVLNRRDVRDRNGRRAGHHGRMDQGGTRDVLDCGTGRVESEARP